MGVRENCNIRILRGFECRVINTKGDVDENEDINGKMDMVLEALHKYPSDVDYESIASEKLSNVKAAEIETEPSINAVRKGVITLLAHL